MSVAVMCEVHGERTASAKGRALRSESRVRASLGILECQGVGLRASGRFDIEERRLIAFNQQSKQHVD